MIDPGSKPGISSTRWSGTCAFKLPRSHQPLPSNFAARARRITPWSFNTLELLSLGAILVFYAFVWAFEGVVEPSTANIVGSSAFIVVLLLTCLAALKVGRLSIWEALFWFRTSCLVYYGVGSLVPHFGSGETVLYMQNLYPFSDRELLKVNTINTTSTLIVLSGSQCIASRKKLRPKSRVPASSRAAMVTASGFVALGAVARYSIMVPSLLGTDTALLSGAAVASAKLYPAGLLILLVIGLRQRPILLVPAIGLTIIDLIVGVLLFNKTDVVITILFTVLAIYHARPSFTRLVLGASISVVLLYQLTPLVTFGRERVAQLTELQAQVTLDQRWSIAGEYFRQQENAFHRNDEFQPLLNRISYVNAMTMVVSWYDQGRPGQTLDTALYFFVPRLIWPEKPILTASGRELYSEATSQLGTSISPGLFAESYWNFGWIGLFILLFPLGIVLRAISNLALQKIEQDNWLYLPCILMGVGIGTRVDGHYVADVLAPTLILFAFYICCRLVELFACIVHRHCPHHDTKIR